MPRVNRDGRTPAHFRVTCAALGIEAPDLAGVLDIDPRSARRWMRTTTAPDAAWRIVDAQAQWVDAVLKAVLDGAEASGPGEIELTTYATDAAVEQAGLSLPGLGVPTPARWHQAAVGHMALALQARGHDVTVSYTPRDTP